jgi:hypothetical protein
MTGLRAFLLCLLAAVMTLTGIGAATARGHMAADGVICGDGTYTVVLAADGLPLFDSGGNPVEAQALPCLDCVLGHAALLPLSPDLVARIARAADLDTPPASVLTARPWRMGGMGRSPPVAA